jgi:hypothetical protein
MERHGKIHQTGCAVLAVNSGSDSRLPNIDAFLPMEKHKSGGRLLAASLSILFGSLRG